MAIDLDLLLKAAGDEKLAANANTFTDLLNSLDSVLNKADKVAGIIHKFERSPLVSTWLRAGWQKAGIEVGPLVKDYEGVVPSTKAHALILDNINKLNEDQLRQLMERLQELDKKKVAEEAITDGKPTSKS